jgi:hypothetical protein
MPENEVNGKLVEVLWDGTGRDTTGRDGTGQDRSGHCDARSVCLDILKEQSVTARGEGTAISGTTANDSVTPRKT